MENLKKFLYWAKEIIVAVVIASVILFFFKPIVVKQSSMEPTFHSGDYIFISKQSYTLFGEMQHGDVVVFHSRLKDDNNRDKNLIKRIIALPGDEIAITGGYVYINGEELEEPYLGEQGQTWAKDSDGDMEPTVVPEGKVFAMGDNRTNSEDSRSAQIGFIDMDEILGKVVIRLYPFDRIGLF